jgi:hypothetical protein
VIGPRLPSLLPWVRAALLIRSIPSTPYEEASTLPLDPNGLRDGLPKTVCSGKCRATLNRRRREQRRQDRDARIATLLREAAQLVEEGQK